MIRLRNIIKRGSITIHLTSRKGGKREIAEKGRKKRDSLLEGAGEREPRHFDTFQGKIVKRGGGGGRGVVVVPPGGEKDREKKGSVSCD